MKISLMSFPYPELYFLPFLDFLLTPCQPVSTQKKRSNGARETQAQVKLEGERERARMRQGVELSGAIVIFVGLWTVLPLVLAHPLWHMTRMHDQ